MGGGNFFCCEKDNDYLGVEIYLEHFMIKLQHKLYDAKG